MSEEVRRHQVKANERAAFSVLLSFNHAKLLKSIIIEQKLRSLTMHTYMPA
jgi:hypothetical protein